MNSIETKKQSHFIQCNDYQLLNSLYFLVRFSLELKKENKPLEHAWWLIPGSAFDLEKNNLTLSASLFLVNINYSLTLISLHT